MTRSAWVIVVTLLAVLAIASTIGDNSRPQYIWNLTPSVPLGLYSLHSPSHLRVTTLVAAIPLEPLASALAEGGYLPRGVPLLKRVFALPGQTVCRIGTRISVDGIAAEPAREHDSRGRPLPAWHGCRVLAADEIFLMNWDEPDSLDGRYFGPLPRSAVIARAIPILTDEAGDGHLVWRAPTE
ncbi:MAG: conjugative transfer signal peptidase TraF [Afipia broomeae]|jgi:conjugative transfer signal peptidase TraF|uniref:S26 family signal peptidase n=1 Tax=Candidatus Afipia apatlaquensis TaxID=2712852 RepID=A0A7C9VK64_9BRAD|nr:S26 family signal peptidase [Afipia sp.]NGX94731.1 S26 family signal peptidase [Candidatus Afipia apatlaquensis]RTL78498.1 MAG: S26 family signal peptidase [Bradyrhizobiaceae bacterium]